MNDHILESDWITNSGYRAVCLMVRNDHRCGYVGIPKEHPLYKKPYSEHTDALKSAYKKIMKGPIGKRGTISVVFHTKGQCTPEIVFDVHGGITYSGNSKDYPVKSRGLWWYGFDCAHCDDKTSYSTTGIERTKEYVMEECESLAKQLKAIKPRRKRNDS